MSKKITCGTIVCSKYGFLALLPTGRVDGQHNYDIPKGCMEETDATTYITAIRELKEETGLDIKEIYGKCNTSVNYFDVVPYNKEKDLALFTLEIDDIDQVFNFACNSYFIDKDGVSKPEMKGYKWTRDLNVYFKGLCNAISKLRNDNEIFDEIISKYEHD